MKHKLFILTAMLVLTTLAGKANFQKLEGNSFTQFGNYTLTETDQITVVNNVAYKVWHLNYANNNETFEVLCAPGNNSQCCFIVRSNEFEIQYSRNEGNFGANLVDSKRSSLKKSLVMKHINKEQLANQKTLTTKEKNQTEYLGLVACFVPLLIS
ncbi:MAG: hypothetical protein JW735_12635 [Prolixibacteraceae bacterium]|nr:hypothetical protein [Prolixibacteraceae bacterium]